MTKKFRVWLESVGLEQKEYQIAGYEWCRNIELGKKELRGGIVCDEMGLGKTILMLGSIITGDPTSRTLIVVPPSLMEQWKACIKKFLYIDAFVYHGINVKNTTLEELNQKLVVLTTYGMIAERKNPRYQSMLWLPTWDRLICDEAHHVRNPQTNICKGAFRIKSRIKWLVTGTPIQNSTKDIQILFALLGKMIIGEKELRAYISQYVLRRTKASVGIVLPNHTRKTIIVGWESKREENLAVSIHAQIPLFGVSVDVNNVNKIMDVLDYEHILPLFVRARQACINPRLLEHHVDSLKEDGVIPEEFHMAKVSTTSKISAVVRKIASQPKKKKKIVFCYYRMEIDELKERLEAENYIVGVMDGRSKKSEKMKACDPETAPDILLAQIQSASEGLNLQHFSQVYFTSPHWNPAVEEQAIARAHRIGQQSSVETFHFEMAPFGEDQLTIDNYCMEVQRRKRELMKMLDQ